MDPESKKLLEETAVLAKENNQMLLSIRRSMKFSRIFRIVYLVFLIGSAIGAYYFLQPYVDEAVKIYDNVTNPFKSLNR